MHEAKCLHSHEKEIKTFNINNLLKKYKLMLAGVFVCMHFFIYVLMHACMHFFIYVLRFACMHACMLFFIYVLMHACMLACMLFFIQVLMLACMHACIYTFLHIRFNACMHAFLYIRFNVFLCVLLLLLLCRILYMIVFEVNENCLLVSLSLTFFIHIIADIFGVHASSPPLTQLVSLLYSFICFFFIFLRVFVIEYFVLEK